jgi:hypothetical protein
VHEAKLSASARTTSALESWHAQLNKVILGKGNNKFWRLLRLLMAELGKDVWK